LHANAPATWFRVVMWIGIAANILLALVSIAWPASVLSRVGLRAGASPGLASVRRLPPDPLVGLLRPVRV
jgi:hypothetical protein